MMTSSDGSTSVRHSDTTIRLLYPERFLHFCQSWTLGRGTFSRMHRAGGQVCLALV